MLRHEVRWNTYKLMNTTREKFISPCDTNVFSTGQFPSSAGDIHSQSWIPIISFSESRKFITFPRAHHRTVSHGTWIYSYIFTPHKKTHFNLKWSTFAKDFQTVSIVLSFRLIILYIFHPLTNEAHSVHLIGLCLSLCYYDTSLIRKKTCSIVFNTYTTLSHTTFRKLLLSCVF